MYDSKLEANRFPGKCMDYFLNFHTVHRDLFFTHVENFEVVIHALKFEIIPNIIKMSHKDMCTQDTIAKMLLDFNLRVGE
jgi:hypothetical protein